MIDKAWKIFLMIIFGYVFYRFFIKSSDDKKTQSTGQAGDQKAADGTTPRERNWLAWKLYDWLKGK